MKNMKILVVGPSDRQARGGISSVIRGMREAALRNSKATLSFFSSFADGNKLYRVAYCLWKFILYICVVWKYDIVHIHMAANGSAYRKAAYGKVAVLFRKKVVIHIHSGRYWDFYEGLSKGRKKYLKAALAKASFVFLLSETQKKEYESVIGLKNAVVLPNGVDCEQFEGIYKERGNSSQSLLFLGRLGERKGTYDLFEVLKEMQNEGQYVHCTMAGDGEVEYFRHKVKEAGLEDCIQILGWVGETERKELLKSASILVLPSYSEGFPMAILEAMAAGKAIVATFVGAIPEVIEDGKNGFLVNPGDKKALQQALDCLLLDRELCLQMGSYNHEKVKSTYSQEKTHRRLYDYYLQTMQKAKEGGDMHGE